jgi:hypothetical protein
MGNVISPDTLSVVRSVPVVGGVGGAVGGVINTVSNLFGQSKKFKSEQAIRDIYYGTRHTVQSASFSASVPAQFREAYKPLARETYGGLMVSEAPDVAIWGKVVDQLSYLSQVTGRDWSKVMANFPSRGTTDYNALPVIGTSTGDYTGSQGAISASVGGVPLWLIIGGGLLALVFFGKK